MAKCPMALAVGWLALSAGAPQALMGHGPQQPSTSALSAISPHRTLLNRYCVTCHNQKLKTANLMLETLDLANVGANSEVWEKVVRKIRAGMMPPIGRPRPDRSTSDELASWLEGELDRAAAQNPNPGGLDAMRRLNRTEYRNTIRDLLDLDVDVAELLPADDSSSGFDNVSLGGLDPGRLEAYLSAARKVSRLAVGTRAGSPVAEIVVVLPSDFRQDDHIEGLPFGTRGGAAVRHNFPVDAEYSIQLTLGRDFLQLGAQDVAGLTEPHELVLTIDGKPVHQFNVSPIQAPVTGAPDAAGPVTAGPDASGPADSTREPRRARGKQKDADADLIVRLPVKAGPRVIGAAFISKGAKLVEQIRQPFMKLHITQGEDERTQPVLYSVTVIGPFEATGVSRSETPSRRRIFTCHPTSTANELRCAKSILSALARRAYRRPVTEADLKVLLNFYEQGRDAGFEAGIEMALRRLLVHPEFLFRVEREPEIASTTTGVYRISDLELASRLSFFLWSSIPDDELLDLAVGGTLRSPGVLERQVRRMLKDRRSETLITNFAAQWLYLRNVPSVTPDSVLFPDFDEGLRRAFQRETELFFESIIREDRSVVDLLSANYTFVNDRLAKHYGIPNIYGSHFRRVTLGPDSPRGGLLGQGSILTVTAYANRTSPVLRGKWVLTNILGTPPPPPIPNVPPLSDKKTEQVLSMRERMVQHRANPVCASCHAMMDPIGLSLENFDAIGRYRTRTDGFAPLDVTGSLPDGTAFEGASGLKKALLNRPELFVQTLTEKLLTYGLGRAVMSYDAPTVRSIARQAARSDYRFSSLVIGIVNSSPFQMKRRNYDH